MAKKSHEAAIDAAQAAIRTTGARVTMARVQILKILLNAGRALSHSEIEAKLGRHYSIDRVTVYRVLDWLTQSGLAHKLTDADRVWHFNAVSGRHANDHAHFTCTCCGGTFCLDDAASARMPKLPAGFRSQHTDVTVRGLCDECSPANHNPAFHGRSRRRKAARVIGRSA
ncbi:MAG: Fur family transcriptional regulator [Burkholderiales bacterium]